MQPEFYAQAAGDAMDTPDRNTYLWRYLYAALREYHADKNYVWVPQWQQDGTCVGQSNKLLSDTALSIDWALRGTPFPGRTAVSGTYPGGRVEIAGKSGRWQGSTNGWTAKFLCTYGVLLLKDLGLDDDARREDERIALRWTASRNGIPVEYEKVCKTRPFTTYKLITNSREAGKAIQAGNPVTLSSSLIPTGKRNKNGFATLRKSGGHSTLAWAVRYKPFGILYQNSWSKNWGSGPKFPKDMPPGSVWLTERDADRIFRSGGCYSVVGPTGFTPIDDYDVVL